jgi:hypothetical protein
MIHSLACQPWHADHSGPAGERGNHSRQLHHATGHDPYAILLGELRNLGVNEVGHNATRMMSLEDPAPNWVELANGMGVEATSVRSCTQFADVLATALKRHGPFLIECVI